MKEFWDSTRTYRIMVDDEDWDKVKNHEWYINTKRLNAVFKSDGITTTALGRFILNITDSKVHVDHRDGNSLNNQKENLRLCSHIQNQWNKPPRRGQKYKEVSYNKDMRKWCAYINKYHRRTYLGWFKTAEEAALAYNEEAIILFGEFAYLNIVE